MIAKLWRRLIRLSFRLLYNEFAFSYDAVSSFVSLGRWRSWQHSALPFLEHDETRPLLELAHGTGNVQLDLLAAKHRTVALDISPMMGRIARHKLAKHGFHTDFVRGDALTLPFRAECFGAIVCTFPTAFIFQGLALSELNRVLTENGCAIIVLSGYLTGGGLMRGVIKFLYRLTGQAPDRTAHEFVSEPLSGAGFAVHFEEVRLIDSVVQLLILNKPMLQGSQGRESHLELSLPSC